LRGHRSDQLESMTGTEFLQRETASEPVKAGSAIGTSEYLSVEFVLSK
jgi:hypothetical protein